MRTCEGEWKKLEENNLEPSVEVCRITPGTRQKEVDLVVGWCNATEDY